MTSPLPNQSSETVQFFDMNVNRKITLSRVAVVNLLLCRTYYTVEKADVPICGTMNFAKLQGDVCNVVEIVPNLQPLQVETFDQISSTEDEARLDIKANGFFDLKFSRTFFNVKIFNPFAISKTSSRSIQTPRILSAHSSLRLQEEQDILHRKLSQYLRSSSATKLPRHLLMSQNLS